MLKGGGKIHKSSCTMRRFKQVTYAPDAPWLFWFWEKPEDTQFEPHAGMKMASVFDPLFVHGLHVTFWQYFSSKRSNFWQHFQYWCFLLSAWYISPQQHLLYSSALQNTVKCCICYYKIKYLLPLAFMVICQNGPCLVTFCILMFFAINLLFHHKQHFYISAF